MAENQINVSRSGICMRRAAFQLRVQNNQHVSARRRVLFHARDFVAESANGIFILIRRVTLKWQVRQPALLMFWVVMRLSEGPSGTQYTCKINTSPLGAIKIELLSIIFAHRRPLCLASFAVGIQLRREIGRSFLRTRQNN